MFNSCFKLIQCNQIVPQLEEYEAQGHSEFNVLILFTVRSQCTTLNFKGRLVYRSQKVRRPFRNQLNLLTPTCVQYFFALLIDNKNRPNFGNKENEDYVNSALFYLSPTVLP